MAYDPKSGVPIWAQITTDEDIDHGAVRLWFYLRNVRRNARTKRCDPGQRRIAKDIHANIHSIKPWIQQLETARYLEKSTQGQQHAHAYSFPTFALRKGATRENSRVATFDTSRCGKRQRGACPKGATEHQSIEHQSMNSRGPRERWQVEKDIKSIREQIDRLSKDTGFWVDQHGVKHPNDKPRPEAQERITKLRQKVKDLEKELDHAR